jgi:chorismate synthase
MNTFGRIFKFTTFGESHGPIIGVVIDGVPSNVTLAAKDIQKYLDLRKPGINKFVSQRKEEDKVEIISGILDGKTTGAPIALLIKNIDAKKEHYKENVGKFRPGHADLTYYSKYKIYDFLGSGRASARETASRVAAGAVARKILPSKVKIYSALVQIGEHEVDYAKFDWEYTKKNILFSPDKSIIPTWESYLQNIRKSGDSIGAKVMIRVTGVPKNLGAPIYGKISADFAAAIMGINGVKGFEIGDGFKVVTQKGSEHADELAANKKKIEFKSNKSGGVLGGITTGEDIIMTFAIKPPSSILKPLKTITTDLKNTQISTIGRHDPCIGIRATQVAEAMVACVLADHYLLNKIY